MKIKINNYSEKTGFRKKSLTRTQFLFSFVLEREQNLVPLRFRRNIRKSFLKNSYTCTKKAFFLCNKYLAEQVRYASELIGRRISSINMFVFHSVTCVTVHFFAFTVFTLYKVLYCQRTVVVVL